MRIAYVIPTYPPAASQPFVVNEMVEVQDAGNTLVVLSLYRDPSESVRHGTFERLRPEHVLPTALCDWRTACLAVWVLLTRPLRVLRTLGAMHRAAGTNPYAHAKLLAVTPKALAAAWRFRRLGVDHVHAHFANQMADCAAIAGSVAGIPFSFTAHAYDIFSRVRSQRNETLGWKLRHARRAFAISNFAAERLRSELPPDERDRVCTAYVGIPMPLFRAEPMPPADGGLRLLAVARFQEKKGLDTLLDACALLRDRGVAFHLAIFGDGPLRPALETQRTRLGLEDVVVIGPAISQEEVARQMQACHLFVLPCRQDRTGDMDGIPTVFMEAMATGRPVVSCPVSGIPELVRDGETGVLVPSEDPSALADAIVRLAADDALRARLGQHARALVERQHDQRSNARRILTLLGLRPGDDAPGGLRQAG
jgi:glycosyltransferase involved in cell wall biosynthesis